MQRRGNAVSRGGSLALDQHRCIAVALDWADRGTAAGLHLAYGGALQSEPFGSSREYTGCVTDGDAFTNSVDLAGRCL